jgi:hypothetical protein
MFTWQNWFPNILLTVRMPYSETRQLYCEYRILNIFQMDHMAATSLSSTLLSLKVGRVQLNTTLILICFNEKLGIFTFHYQPRDHYSYALSSNYTSFINPFIYRCIAREHFLNFCSYSENFTHSLMIIFLYD